LKIPPILVSLIMAARQTGGWLRLLKKGVSTLCRRGPVEVLRRIRGMFDRQAHATPPDSERAARLDYDRWIALYDQPDEATLVAIRQAGALLQRQPLLSIVMPTYRPNLGWIAEAIDSVREQTWPHWQLCIADDASCQPELRALLEDYARLDARIELVFRDRNGHIAEASNSALSLARGDWVLLLDHDDLLPPHALYCVAKAINEQPQARLIYSDEDKIDEQGRRFNPYFKSDWNRDLFYSHNMFSHLGCYELELLRDVGGFRVGTEGSQDYDLALRCIEIAGEAAIHHIPRVLYHWRVHAESTAKSADAKPYAMVMGERVINEHFARTGVSGRVELQGAGYRPFYEIPEPAPLASILIPTRNGLKLLRNCIDSIETLTRYSSYEIIVIDNGSDEPATLEYLRELETREAVRVIRDDRPFNYSALNNLAASVARGQVLVLLNNDVQIISHDWLGELVAQAIRPIAGAVGARLWYGNNTLQHAGLLLGVGGVANPAHHRFSRLQPDYFGRSMLTQSFSAVTAACLAVRRELYLKMGGLDEINLAVAFNDVDFCLRLREAGYSNIYAPYAELYHHESVSRGPDNSPEKVLRLQREEAWMWERWGDILRNDPAYNPNLSLEFSDFSYAWPPRVESLT
jgi:GT2 family glycosyltransferase